MQQESIAHFGSVAQEYHSTYSEASAQGHTLRMRKARVLELLGEVRGRVLDVGCGPGVMVEEILRRDCTFCGVDGSPQMIEECERLFGRLPTAHFQVGDARALPFPDDSFDAVLCMGVMDRIAEPPVAMAEMGRVLRPGGILLISFPNRLSPYAYWRSHIYYRALGHLKRLIAMASRDRRQFRLAAPAQLWSPGAAVRAVGRQVGDVQDVAYYNFGALLSPLEELFPAAGLWLAQRLEGLRRSGIRWLGAGFVVKVVKPEQRGTGAKGETVRSGDARDVSVRRT